MKTLCALITATALLTGAAAYGGDAPPAGGITMSPAFSAVAADAGGYSLATGEQIVESAAFVAYVEDMDASVHPAFGNVARDVLILRTAGGHYVVRILGPRSEAITN